MTAPVNGKSDTGRTGYAWRIERDPSGEAAIAFAHRRIPTRIIRGARVECVAEPTSSGALVCFTLFLLLGGALLVGTVEFGLNQRTLIGVVLFLALGLMALQDAQLSRPMTLYRVHVMTDTGEERFSTPSLHEAEALMVAMGSAR